MNLKEFLEEEREDTIKDLFFDGKSTNDVRESIINHDTRLINKILDEVKDKVNKLDTEQINYGLDTVSFPMIIKIDVLNILDQLKLK